MRHRSGTGVEDIRENASSAFVALQERTELSGDTKQAFMNAYFKSSFGLRPRHLRR